MDFCMLRKQIFLGIFLKGYVKGSNCLITPWLPDCVSLNVPPCYNCTTQVLDFTQVIRTNVQGKCTVLLK